MNEQVQPGGGTAAAVAILTRGWTASRVVMVTLTVLAVALGFTLLLRFYAVIFILFVAIVLSIAIRPATEGLHRLRLPTAAAVILVYVALLAVAALFVLLVAPLIIEQVSALVVKVPDYYGAIRGELVHSPILLVRGLAYQLPANLAVNVLPAPAPAPAAASGGAKPAPSIDLFLVADSSLKIIFVATSILALAFYWTLNGARNVRALLLRVPSERRDTIRDLIAEMENKVGAFLRGQVIVCASVGGAMLVALLIIGLPYALSLGLLAGIFELIPILGPTLGAIPALLVALATAPDKVLWVIVAVIIIQQLESNLLIPRVMDKSVGVNPVVTILSIGAFGALLGLPGALLAIPLAAVIQVVIGHLVYATTPAIPLEQGRNKASVLRYEAQQLMQDVRKEVREKDEVVKPESDQVEDLIESIATDIDSLLAQQKKTTPANPEEGA
jgi:predicted PurR-regulated permease PerM